MAERPVGVTDQAAGAGVAEVRTRERSVGGNTVAEQFVIPIRERVPSFIGMAATFRTVGTAAAAPHWIFHMANTTGSTVLLMLRSLTYYQDVTGATVAPNVIATLCRPTGTVAGGTSLTKVSVGTGVDAAQTSAANVTLLGATASDGGVATAITGLTLANRLWRTTGLRAHTLVGQVGGAPKELLPAALRDHGVVLRAGEQIGVALEYAAAADNPATFYHVVNVCFEEYTLP